jgi:hypothetical protein
MFAGFPFLTSRYWRLHRTGRQTDSLRLGGSLIMLILASSAADVRFNLVCFIAELVIGDRFLGFGTERHSQTPSYVKLVTLLGTAGQ